MARSRGAVRATVRNDPALYGGPYPFVQTGDIKAAGLRLWSYEQTYSEVGLAQSRLWPAGTLCITIAANIGDTAILGLPACFPDSIVGFIARPGVSDTTFVKYLLDATKQRLTSISHGATQDNLSLKKLMSQDLYVPPLIEQQRIAEILEAYDNLIEINRSRVALLEEMARGLFEEWFVRLRFPGRSEADPTSVDLGGWRRRALVDVCAMVRGRSYRSVELVEGGGMPFVNLKCVLRDGGFKASGMKRYSGPFKAQHVVSRGDIVMAVTDMTQERRIVGRVARIPLLAEPESVISMDLVKVVPAREIDPTFLYAWLRYSGFGVTAAQHANGANVLHLSPSAVDDFPILVPPREIQEAFGRQMAPLIELAETLAITEGTLAATRDLLLPRLISGQLSVAEAELDLAQAA